MEEAAVPKVKAILGSALFFVAAPVVVAGFGPWWIARWEFRRAFLGVGQTRIIGVVLIIVGAVGLLDSFARFALQGLQSDFWILSPVLPCRGWARRRQSLRHAILW
jgi:hypothetical protein